MMKILKFCNKKDRVHRLMERPGLCFVYKKHSNMDHKAPRLGR
jgi:hypothetical protein